MNKTVTEGVIIVFLFISSFLLLRQVDWISLTKMDQLTIETEEKLGEIFEEVFINSGSVVENENVLNSIDSIVTKICSENLIYRDYIKVHVIEEDEINAFALPNGHLILYTGLILESANPEELSGVLAHEIAHIELNHVMQKLVKEVGLSVLISMTTGKSGTEIIKETTKIISSTAFDRSLETEADKYAVEYLLKAKITPEPYADFLYKISEEESEVMEYLSWISTHPNTKERAVKIIEYIGDQQVGNEPILSHGSWDHIQSYLGR